MRYDEKTCLALTGQSDREAAALRIRAARKAIGLSQSQLGAAIDRADTTIIAIEKARQLPSWTLMMWFFNNHRIDINFFVSGHFSQLPEDVQERLFDSLAAVTSDKDGPLY